MSFLSRSEILAANDLPIEELDVPEWGGRVRLVTLTGEQRDEFESSQVKFNKKGRPEQNMANLRARLVSMVLVGEDDKPIFAQYDIPQLGRKSAKALDRVFEKAAEMNGFSDDDLEKLTQDFGTAPSEAPTTA